MRVRHSSGLGFTLIELLTCIGIIAVVCGIVFPVLVSAKRAAKQSVEISNLRQIGIAGALYHEENGSEPLGLPPLVPSRVPEELAVSPADSTKQGFANLVLDEISSGNSAYQQLKTAYRRTYIGFYDYGWTSDKWEACTTDAPNPGWLISFTPSNFDPRFSIAKSTGRYHRLQMDGSVRDYQLKLITTPLGRAWWPVSFFVDINDLQEWNKTHPKCSLQ